MQWSAYDGIESQLADEAKLPAGVGSALVPSYRLEGGVPAVHLGEETRVAAVLPVGKRILGEIGGQLACRAEARSLSGDALARLIDMCRDRGPLVVIGEEGGEVGVPKNTRGAIASLASCRCQEAGEALAVAYRATSLWVVGEGGGEEDTGTAARGEDCIVKK